MRPKVGGQYFNQWKSEVKGLSVPGGQGAGKNSPSEENESVDTDQDVAVGVDLQEVSIHGVKHEPPEDASKEISEGICDCLDFLHLSAKTS